MRQSPTDYSQELADRILAGMGDGLAIKTICEADGMPDRVTVWRWLREYPDFSERFDQAQRERAQSLVDDMSRISDDASLDPNDKRIRVDTRKWLASKILPKLYGDKVQLSGDEDGAPLVVTWATAGQGKA